MKKEELIADLEKRAGTLNFALPMLGGQAVGSRISRAFGEMEDLTTEEGRRKAKQEDLKGRGVGALAGLLAGLYLNRSGGVKSFRLHGLG